MIVGEVKSSQTSVVTLENIYFEGLNFMYTWLKKYTLLNVKIKGMMPPSAFVIQQVFTMHVQGRQHWKELPLCLQKLGALLNLSKLS